MKLIQALLISIALFISSLSHASTLDEIMKTGVLKVGTTGDFPGWSFMNPETNEYEGYDIDVAKKLAEDMGVDIEFVATDWKNLVSGVVASKYHMTSSASITTKRALTAGYSNSYYGTGTVAMTLAKNLENIGSWDNINNANTTVAVTLGTVFENEAKKLKIKRAIELIKQGNTKTRTMELLIKEFKLKRDPNNGWPNWLRDIKIN